MTTVCDHCLVLLDDTISKEVGVSIEASDELSITLPPRQPYWVMHKSHSVELHLELK